MIRGALPLLLLACATETAEPPAALDCASEPVVTWENVGEGLMIENCQSCHASTSLNRNGAPESVVFDTHTDVITFRSRILAVTAPDTRTMPPSLALSDDDRHLLQVWLECWE
ncbi:hypothetical protein LBMAG42_05080 [Deltaproteobacteria bacterium]|nr:hypothetical protein LBMAG42_05080 [Deltaproteobacteria bacterium]